MKGLIKLSFILLLCQASFGFEAMAQNTLELANEYYSQGELEKARSIYEELLANRKNIALLHNNYLTLLQDMGDYKVAERYLKRTALKHNPQNIYYKMDLGILYNRMGKTKDAEETFEDIITESFQSQSKARITAQYFVNKRLMDYAIETYLGARKSFGDKSTFALELATIYRVTGKRDEMLEEYFTYLTNNPGSLQYVKNVLQNTLKEEEDLVFLENVLYEKVQAKPNDDIYIELLIWVNLQQKNFKGALIQAKAFDTRYKTAGTKCMEIARIAYDNEDYKVAKEAYEFVVQRFDKGNYYAQARRGRIRAREALVKNTYPVDQSEILALVGEYDRLVDELGFNRITLESMRSKALLYAFYLNEMDKALIILQQVINSGRSTPNLVASCKLDMGDIYLLQGEPWESTLLYSQVEKANKETPIAYEAKLKNAKLSYYKGDFTLAQEHLDILKMATTRQISNDAIALSLLIKDNTILDTSDMVMRSFAAVELMLFQNKKQEALETLEGLATDNPTHPILDEIMWLQAKVNTELGNFAEAITLLQRIVDDYDYDILSDDAYFKIAEIYEQQLGNEDKAMEIYKDFLLRYPGSVFVAEARKRFRVLRGDFMQQQ